METYKRRFVDFMKEVGVLRFGDFITKSGRKTPYFINTGLYRTGSQLQRLGEFYADVIEAELVGEVDVLFGPAYKGIPLVVVTAAVLAQRGTDISFCFNRKEAKNHGEKGVLVGHSLRDGDRVLILEDVTTAGTSIHETVPILRQAANIELVGLVVSVDRQERGQGNMTALADVGREYEMKTFSIVDVHDIMQYGDMTADELQRMQQYLTEFGPRN